MGGSLCYSKTYLPDLREGGGGRQNYTKKSWGTCWIAGWPLCLQRVIFYCINSWPSIRLLAIVTANCVQWVGKLLPADRIWHAGGLCPPRDIPNWLIWTSVSFSFLLSFPIRVMKYVVTERKSRFWRKSQVWGQSTIWLSRLQLCYMLAIWQSYRTVCLCAIDNIKPKVL
jgi:hypothetical protein